MSVTVEIIMILRYCLFVRMFQKTFLLVFIYALGIIPAFAQEKASLREDLWVCPVFESGWYGVSGMAIGGGAALGYGDRLAFGLKVVYWNDLKELSALELNFLARYYFFSMNRTKVLEAKALEAEAVRPDAGHFSALRSGPFIQLNGGPVIFAQGENTITVPSPTVTISAGLSLGWRFLLVRYFFMEPSIRGGYPYFAVAGLSAGARF
jgi:hypothetical protein